MPRDTSVALELTPKHQAGYHKLDDLQAFGQVLSAMPA
jgi:hypothetical protein